jgi:hypothetical protein
MSQDANFGAVDSRWQGMDLRRPLLEAVDMALRLRISRTLPASQELMIELSSQA